MNDELRYEDFDNIISPNTWYFSDGEKEKFKRCYKQWYRNSHGVYYFMYHQKLEYYFEYLNDRPTSISKAKKLCENQGLFSLPINANNQRIITFAMEYHVYRDKYICEILSNIHTMHEDILEFEFEAEYFKFITKFIAENCSKYEFIEELIGLLKYYNLTYYTEVKEKVLV